MSVRAIKVIPNEWRIERSDAGGDMTIKVNDFVYLTLHYDYRYTNNATQWGLAKHIICTVAGVGDTGWSQDGDTDFLSGDHP